MRVLTPTAFVVLVLGASASACAAGGKVITLGPADGSVEESDAGLESGSEAGLVDGPAGEVDYAALFGPPTGSATPNSLMGLWSGTSARAEDMRVKFGPTSIVVAIRCSGGGTRTAGLTIAAKVSSSSIKTLESKSVTSPSGSSGSSGAFCGFELTPREVQNCDTGGGSGLCFYLTGTTLDLGDHELLLTSSKPLTKLSD